MPPRKKGKRAVSHLTPRQDRNNNPKRTIRITTHDDRLNISALPELLAQSPALAVASKILSGMGGGMRRRDDRQDDPKEEASLADMFIASTYTLPKDLRMNKREAEQLAPALLRYRILMRDAHRFVLDDDYTRLATEVSNRLTPKKLLHRLFYATLPYETTWIEFDLRIKVHTMRAFHQINDPLFNFADVSPRLGLLLHRLSDTAAVCELVSEMQGTVMATLICYFFSTTEHDFTRHDGRRVDCQPFSSTEGVIDRMLKAGHDIGKGALWGFSSEPTKKVMVETIDDMATLAIPDFLEHHGDSGYSGMFRPISHITVQRGGKNIKTMADVMAKETAEFTGMMRWVVTVLTMLNEVPMHAEHVQPAGTIRTGLTARRKMVDYHRVTIRLPKTDPVAYIERHFRHTSRHRAHEVRSHWRTYVKDNKTCKPDDHDWTYDHEEGFRLCGICFAFGRRIPEHIRGDATLGWVNKQYVIKSTQNHGS
jgi:hypothetical protein